MPLSAVGRAQARAVADALAFTPLTRAYASDLGRAIETAEIVAKPHGLAVVTDARLREFNFGEWEGLTWAQIVERWPELADRPYTDAHAYQPAGGERFDDVVARVGAFLHGLPSDAAECILIVAHAGALHAALVALGLPDETAFNAASLTRIAMEAGNARIITINDVSHLDPRA